jgi:hypothetical protein
MPKITVHGGPTNRFEPGEGPETDGPQDEPQEAAEQPQTVKPSVGDPKAVWIDYAVAQGWLRDDAEVVTKQQLIAQFKG